MAVKERARKSINVCPPIFRVYWHDWARYHTLFFHLLNQAGGAVIADLQAPLHIAGRGAPVARDNGNSLS